MIDNINHITLAVTDIERSFVFYYGILGLKPLCKWDKGAYFIVGNHWFCLNLDSKRTANECYTHYAFNVPPEKFDLMREKIIASNVKNFKENTSEGESFYFLDPDGHKLEIHVGNWQTRISDKKLNLGQWKNVTWYI